MSDSGIDVLDYNISLCQNKGFYNITRKTIKY